MVSEKRQKRFFTLKRQEAALGWLFVSPALIGFSIFTFGSILYSLYLSMTDWNLLSKPNFIGLANYVRAFTEDKYFYKYFGNTFYFVFALVPIVLVISLMLAMLINKKVGRISNAYRVALFLPSITSTVAVSMVWIWIFNPNMGIASGTSKEVNDMKKMTLGMAAKKRLGNVVYHTFMIILSFIMIYPFVWSVLSSFKTSDQLYRGNPLAIIPQPATFDNYKRLFEVLPFEKFITNSVFLAIAMPFSRSGMHLEG